MIDIGIDSVAKDDSSKLQDLLEDYAKSEAETPVKVEEDELQMSIGKDISDSIDMSEIYANAPVTDSELKALIDELVD